MSMPRILRNLGVVLPGLALVMAGFAAAAAPAQATHVACGDVITESITLDSDLGPCPGDGIIVRGSNLTIDLGGFTVFAANGGGDNAGIRLDLATAVVVRNGTVSGFDAGVVIDFGSGNTIIGLTVRDNINDMLGGACVLGEGIAVRDSSGNTITLNSVVNNGPFGGISLVGNSDNNIVSFNQIRDQNVQGRGSSGCQAGRDGEGVRLVGPGANGNLVDRNTVTGSREAGIGIWGNVCSGPPDDIEAPNTGNVISRNTVTRTRGSVSDGITIHWASGLSNTCAAFGNTIDRNISSDNAGSGIYVAPGSHHNVVNRNVVNRNGSGAGLYLDGPVSGNAFTNVGPTLFDLESPDRPPYVEGTDYSVMPGSGSGDITALLVPVDIALAPGADATGNPQPVDTSTSGCEQNDYAAAGFQPGALALLQRGTCTFDAKVDLAIANGATGVVMFNEGQSPSRTTHNFGSIDGVVIPVLSASYAAGFELYNLTQAGSVTAHIVTNTTNTVVERVPGAHDNVLSKNSGRDNAGVDAYDGNLSPACDNNDWERNVFGTVNQACIAEGGVGQPRVVTLAPAPSRGGPSTIGG